MSDHEFAASLDINMLLENSRLWREALQAPRTQFKYVASQTLLSTRYVQKQLPGALVLQSHELPLKVSCC